MNTFLLILDSLWIIGVVWLFRNLSFVKNHTLRVQVLIVMFGWAFLNFLAAAMELFDFMEAAGEGLISKILKSGSIIYLLIAMLIFGISNLILSGWLIKKS